jgi:hypothetical protein
MQANRKQETIIQKAGMAVAALQRRGSIESHRGFPGVAAGRVRR